MSDLIRRNIDELLNDMAQPQRWQREERDTETIPGQLAEALGNLEDALCWLGRVNVQYKEEDWVAAHGLRPCSPAVDFWLQTELAEDAVKGILDKLRRVQPLASKEGGV